ncbi:MAG TPA: zinc-dependent metalloprotease [Vicinamibacterales bacterium]|nr:zinc-dependent metalloprotease [Vicinamibacterales bacterium]
MTAPRRFLLLAVAVACLAAPALAQTTDTPQADKTPEKLPSIADKTKGMEQIDGFMPLYWQARTGKLFMEIGRWHQEILYLVSLPGGLGSNPVGLDRNQYGDTAIVTFERVGPKVLMMQPNYQYRAISSNQAERQAVADSFAKSVLWGFKVEAEDGDRVLVDATSFFMRDAHDVVGKLRQTKQGTYKLDDSRSALYMARTKGFPKNTEVETTLTFTTDQDPGRYIRQTTPDPKAVTLREHHSFVELPDGHYTPRRLDPRAPSFGIEFYDYATPINEPVEKRWIVRHRLEKKDPNAAVSDVVKPIVYYVDNGAPEVVRNALVEGASWWAEAFEAAGFHNAFQVKVLPADADPMDVRYNMINWVDRATRGWSYGGAVVDPRTGEVIKGNVTLGSLRVRQDYTIGSGLIPQFAEGDDNPLTCIAGLGPDPEELAALAPNGDVMAMALARIRQLAAHETGHTLGFAHNFAASSYGQGASVMDYPSPQVGIIDGKLDLSHAYASGIGDFDKFAVKYAYTEFPSGTDEAKGLEQILEDGVAHGMLYITDEDARPASAAHPLASLWDDPGTDPVKSLKHEMEVRKIALDDFGLTSIPVGTPLSQLELKLLPLYLHHRYQLFATAKSLGGAYFTYAVRTASGPNPSRVVAAVPAAAQKAALDAILDTIGVDALRIPTRILDLIPPTAAGYGGGTAEPFGKRTDRLFDPISAATTDADLAISLLLEPTRAARTIEQHGRTPASPGFGDVVNALLDRTWGAPRPADGYGQTIQDAVQTLAITRLMELASDADASPDVRAYASAGLRRVKTMTSRLTSAHAMETKDNITRFLARPAETFKKTTPLAAPAGEPIGGM